MPGKKAGGVGILGCRLTWSSLRGLLGVTWKVDAPCFGEETGMTREVHSSCCSLPGLYPAWPSSLVPRRTVGGSQWPAGPCPAQHSAWPVLSPAGPGVGRDWAARSLHCVCVHAHACVTDWPGHRAGIKGSWKLQGLGQLSACGPGGQMWFQVSGGHPCPLSLPHAPGCRWCLPTSHACCSSIQTQGAVSLPSPPQPPTHWLAPWYSARLLSRCPSQGHRTQGRSTTEL